MPAPARPQSSSTGLPAPAPAAKARNIVNVDELDAWLESFAIILGDEAPPALEAREARAHKARSWLSSVARNWMLRHGVLSRHRARPEGLAQRPAWIQAAIKNKLPLHNLALHSVERTKIESILDWMRSQDGPSPSSDWSRISVEQAQSAEKLWVQAMSKTAAKRDLEASESSETSFFCSAEASMGTGWRWVKLLGEKALQREGLLMSHCVASYANAVLDERCSIYSLRDPDNKPALTIEASGSHLLQLKARANQPCPPTLAPCARDFCASFALLHGPAEVLASVEFQDIGLLFIPGLGLAAHGDPVPVGWENSLAQLLERRDAAGEPFDHLLLIGLALADMADLLALAIPYAPDSSLRSCLSTAAGHGSAKSLPHLISAVNSRSACCSALEWSATNGHAKCVELLIPACRVRRSSALLYATRGGHSECVRLLVPAYKTKAIDHALAEASSFGYSKCVRILSETASAKAIDEALSRVTDAGFTKCLRILLKAASAKAIDKALSNACEYGDAQCLTILAKAASAKAIAKKLSTACAGGREECVKLLASSSPKVVKTQRLAALRLAAENGHPECVELLLSATDNLKARRSKVLRNAILARSERCVELLMPVSQKKMDKELIKLAISSGNPKIAHLIMSAPRKLLSKADISKIFKHAQKHSDDMTCLMATYL